MISKIKNIKNKIPIFEEFYSIQGEGFNVGKASYFLRTGGCDIGCLWCDSKNSWKQETYNYININDIVNRIKKTGCKTVIITGGEPLIHNFDEFCKKVKAANIVTMLETCGAHDFSGNWDWICLSPKKQKPPKDNYYNIANELKVIICSKNDFEWAEFCADKVSENCFLYLQPEWSKYETTSKMVVDYVKKKSRWNVSVQMHKFLKIP